jgi:hypothetical protein
MLDPSAKSLGHSISTMGLVEKAMILPKAGNILLQAFIAAFTGLLRPGGRPSQYSRYITYTAVRTFLNTMTIKQQQYVYPSLSTLISQQDLPQGREIY